MLGFMLVCLLTCEILCACMSKTKVGQNVFLLYKQYTVEKGFVIHYNIM